MDFVIAVLEIMGYLAIGIAIGVAAELDECGAFINMLIWPVVILAFIVLCVYEAVYNGFTKIYKYLSKRWSTWKTN